MIKTFWLTFFLLTVYIAGSDVLRVRSVHDVFDSQSGEGEKLKQISSISLPIAHFLLDSIYSFIYSVVNPEYRHQTRQI